MDVEKRRNVRHTFICEMECTLQSGAAQVMKTLKCRVMNISAGGIGVVTNEAVESMVPLQVRLRPPGVPAPISSLMQVRWTAPVAVPRGTYRLGLFYLA